MKTLPLCALLLLALTVSSGSWFADDGGTVACPAMPGTAGTFADCTKAKCSWDGQSKLMDCPCVVKDDVASVTSGECMDGTDRVLQSRYPGVASMGICTSATNYWADCLGVQCGPDHDGGTRCACRVTTSKDMPPGQYVIVGVSKDGAPAACASDVYYSSAAPGQVFAASSVLGSGTPAISWVYP